MFLKPLLIFGKFMVLNLEHSLTERYLVHFPYSTLDFLTITKRSHVWHGLGCLDW